MKIAWYTMIAKWDHVIVYHGKLPYSVMIHGFVFKTYTPLSTV